MSTIEHIVTPEELMAYLDGELPPDRASVVRAHVEACPACQQAAAELRQVSDEMRRWEMEPAPERLRTPAMPPVHRSLRSVFTAGHVAPRHAAAAALCIVAVGAAFWVAEFGPPFAARKAPIASAEPTTIVVGGGRRPGGAGGNAAGRTEDLAARVQGQLDQVERQMHAPLTAAPQVASAGRAMAAAPPIQTLQGPSTNATATEGKIARTVSLALVTQDMAAVRPAIETLLRELGGFVGTIQASGEGNTATLRATLRIPVQRLEQAITGLRALGRVTDETQSGEDVGEQVRDLGARLTNSRNTEKRLTEVLRTRTGDVSDVLEVEREIARVREEIERMDATRAHLERRVAYATITLHVEQERQATLDMGRLPLPTQFRNAFVDGVRHAFESIVDVALSLLQVAPLLLMWLLLLWWPLRLAIRRGRGVVVRGS